MNLFYGLISFLLALVFLAAGVTRISAWLIERRNPPVGVFATVNGTRMHYVHVPSPTRAVLPPLVFIHGASGNLNDQMAPFRKVLEGRAEMLFLDRPGHGWSERGANNDNPHGQAATIALLMAHVGIADAIIVGHSFGAAVSTTFALDHAGQTRGLVLLSPATHPWPGGATSWYYALTSKPIIGWLFSQTLSTPGGFFSLPGAVACVFSPNRAPDVYARQAAIELVLRPRAFRANAIDVEGLFRHAVALAPRYREIATPTVIISGDRDTVVYEEIHAAGLARDIPGAELVWVKNLGHKPDWIATDLAVSAIERASGRDVDLEAQAREVEARIAVDNFGVGICVDEKPPTAAPELNPAQ